MRTDRQRHNAWASRVMKADAPACSPLRMSTMIRLYLLFHNTVQEHTNEATRPSRMPKTTDSGPWAMRHPLFPVPCVRPPPLPHHVCAQEQRGPRQSRNQDDTGNTSAPIRKHEAQGGVQQQMRRSRCQWCASCRKRR